MTCDVIALFGAEISAFWSRNLQLSNAYNFLFIKIRNFRIYTVSQKIWGTHIMQQKSHKNQEL